MNCIETDTLLTLAEALGDLPERKLAHVAQCATCRSTLLDLGMVRAAFAPEALPPHQLDRVAVSIEPLAKRRRREKGELAALFVCHFLVVSLTLGLCLAMMGGFGLEIFAETGLLLAWPSETPLAFLVGFMVAWRAYRVERARLGRTGQSMAVQGIGSSTA